MKPVAIILVLLTATLINAIAIPPSTPDYVASSITRQLIMRGYGITTGEAKISQPVQIDTAQLKKGTIPSDYEPVFACYGDICNASNVEIGRTCATFNQDNAGTEYKIGMVGCVNEYKSSNVYIIITDTKPESLAHSRNACQGFLDNGTEPTPAPPIICKAPAFSTESFIRKTAPPLLLWAAIASLIILLPILAFRARERGQNTKATALAAGWTLIVMFLILLFIGKVYSALD